MLVCSSLIIWLKSLFKHWKDCRIFSNLHLWFDGFFSLKFVVWSLSYTDCVCSLLICRFEIFRKKQPKEHCVAKKMKILLKFSRTWKFLCKKSILHTDLTNHFVCLPSKLLSYLLKSLFNILYAIFYNQNKLVNASFHSLLTCILLTTHTHRTNNRDSTKQKNRGKESF